MQPSVQTELAQLHPNSNLPSLHTHSIVVSGPALAERLVRLLLEYQEEAQAAEREQCASVFYAMSGDLNLTQFNPKLYPKKGGKQKLNPKLQPRGQVRQLLFRDYM